MSYDDNFIHSHSHVEEPVEVKTTPSEPVSRVMTAPVEGGTMQFAIDLINTVMSKMAEQQVASKLSELDIHEKELDNARRIADENWKRQKAWEEEKRELQELKKQADKIQPYNEHEKPEIFFKSFEEAMQLAKITQE